MIRSQRGATSLLELLMVVTLIGVLLPLVFDILKNAVDHLSPIGFKGRKTMACETLDSTLRSIECDIDRVLHQTDLIQSDNVLEIAGTNEMVRYVWEGGKLYRQVIRSPQNEMTSRLLARNISVFNVEIKNRLVKIELETVIPGQAEYPIKFITSFCTPSP